MFIRTEKATNRYYRKSKLGTDHEYYRETAVIVLRCDNCGNIFSRPKGSMDPKRLSNNYFHVCSNCNSKKFAQQKGKDRKKVWDLPASSLTPIGKI
jgi:DNA-directed RNA polymerase subunit RPC12/RpoP